MKTTLSNIVSIQTGFFARPDNSGDVVCLQSKHFDELGNITAQLFPELDSSKISQKHFLHSGDVLFAAKGTKNFAAIFQQIKHDAVASTSFFVLRIKDEYKTKILPEYIAWYINLPSTIGFLKEKSSGTSIVSISKPTLSRLEIPLPSTEKQQKILNIMQLKQKEKTLQMQINQFKNLILQHKLIQSIL